MRKFLPYIFRFLVFCFLTTISQIGGIIYLLCFPLYRWIDGAIESLLLSRLMRLIGFCAMYYLCSQFLVPALAQSFDRVRLEENEYIQPVTVWTKILNRDYVRPEMNEILGKAALELYNKSHGAVTKYMDAGFPFWDGWKLFPHLSHKNGKTVDLAFFYMDNTTNQETNEKPSASGYGAFEEPKGGEEKTSEYCKSKGNNWYDMAKYFNWGFDHANYRFDANRTHDLLRLFAKDERVQHIILESYLEKRLNLGTMSKILNPQCEASRHDDHFHLSIR
jgi:hypothetical protein